MPVDHAGVGVLAPNGYDVSEACKDGLYSLADLVGIIQRLTSCTEAWCWAAAVERIDW